MDVQFALVSVASEVISLVARVVRVVVAWIARIGVGTVIVSGGGVLYG